jgi:hypothetical protein
MSPRAMESLSMPQSTYPVTRMKLQIIILQVNVQIATERWHGIR